MYVPVKLGELTVVQGHSGRGLQVTCTCGCVNWNHLEMNDPIWKCRNCGRVFTYTFPLLVQAYMAAQKTEKPPTAPPPEAGNASGKFPAAGA